MTETVSVAKMKSNYDNIFGVTAVQQGLGGVLFSVAELVQELLEALH